MKSDTTFDFKSLQKVLSQIYLEDEGKYSSCNRFGDLSAIDRFEVNLSTFVENLQIYRQISPLKDDVKMAIYFPSDTPFTTTSFAQLFMDIVENDSFQIQIFNSLDECAEFLCVDRELLRI